ncbi:MAG: hypothetical protein IPJ34_40880 [Myxococcales bacterium]|nr:hypothetical protein [Myxococcales bacterium]
MNDRPQHYVKLSAPAEVDLGRIAGVSPGRQLATMLLRDLLGERHELVVGHAQTSGNAEKLWLYGSRFTALVLVRANATDEFEVERVYPANPPTVGSIPYPAELELTHLRSGKRSADLSHSLALVRTAQPTQATEREVGGKHSADAQPNLQSGLGAPNLDHNSQG